MSFTFSIDEAVGVGMQFDPAGAVEGKVFETDVLQRADAEAEVVVAAEFQVRLGVELEFADVGDAAQGDVAEGTVECRAVVESLHAGQQADGNWPPAHLRDPVTSSTRM